MTQRLPRKPFHIAILLGTSWLCGSAVAADTNDPHALIEEGNVALAQNKLHDAAAAFQKAVDLNPSSAKAHEGLGMALSRELLSGNVRPSADSDVFERAENPLTQAIDLAPSSATPLIQLSELEAAVAERSLNSTERSDRYKKATDLLKRAVALEPDEANLYLHLASLERDEFGPLLQQAAARSATKSGPIADTELRHSLQREYGHVIDDAIANAKQASQMNANSTKPLLLTARLLRQRALIRENQDQYTSDMQSADDWQRQFLAVGGHLGPEDGSPAR